MKRKFIGFFVGLAALVAISTGIFYLAWGLAGRVGGYASQVELIPFMNAHLAEEAADGSYRIWTDTWYIFTMLATVLIPFSLAAGITTRLSDTQTARGVVLFGLVLLGWQRKVVFYSFCPWSFRMAFAIEVAIAFIGGTWASRIVQESSGRHFLPVKPKDQSHE